MGACGYDALTIGRAAGALVSCAFRHMQTYGEVQLCAFDVLASDGEHVPDLSLLMRKANFDRLLRGRPDGMFINPFKIDATGPALFRGALRLWL